MTAWTRFGSVPKVGGSSAASRTASRPLVPAPKRKQVPPARNVLANASAARTISHRAPRSAASTLRSSDCMSVTTRAIPSRSSLADLGLADSVSRRRQRDPRGEAMALQSIRSRPPFDFRAWLRWRMRRISLTSDNARRKALMRVFALISLAISIVSSLAAAEKKPLTAEELWTLQRVGNPVVSPDGKTAVYTVNVYDMEADRGNSDIWISLVSGRPAKRLTTNKASDGSPAWSPDGRRIAFVSKREDDKAAQIYVLPVDGGEPERLTDMPLPVSNPKWFPDGSRIAFVSSVIAGAETPEATKKAVEAREKSKVKARVSENRLYRYWDHWLTDGEYARIFAVDVATKKVTDLLSGSKRIFGLEEGAGSFDISPDGAWVAFEANSTPEPYHVWNTDIFLVPISGGEPKNLTADNPAEDKNPVFSPDGRSLAYGLERKADGWPDQTRLAVLDLASGKTSVLTEDFDRSCGGWRWTPDGAAIVFQAEARARGNLYVVSARGARRACPLRGQLALPPGRDRGHRPRRQGLPLRDELQRRRDGEARSRISRGDDVRGRRRRDGSDVRGLPAGLRREEEVPPRAVDPRRPCRHLRRYLRLPLEPPRLRRARLHRRHGELPRLLELRPRVDRVHPGRSSGQALR